MTVIFDTLERHASGTNEELANRRASCSTFYHYNGYLLDSNPNLHAMTHPLLQAFICIYLCVSLGRI